MIIKNNEAKLIKIYMCICEYFEKDLKFHCQRFSNNDKPEVTDQEVLTIFIYSIYYEQRFKCKQIHTLIIYLLLVFFLKHLVKPFFCLLFQIS